MSPWSPYPYLDEISEVVVEGMIDTKGVRYIGSARRQPNGRWRALADVGGRLCIVEASITFEGQS